MSSPATSVLASDTQRPGSAPSRESRLARVLALAALALTMVNVVRRATVPLHDPDLWWHLRLGEEFLGGWSLSDPGQLTPFATKPWFARSWLPQVGLARLEAALGLPGVAWFYGFLLTALVLVVYLVARRRADLLAAAFTTVTVLLGAGTGLTGRPHLLSYLVLVVATGAWVTTIRTLRPPWWLIPVTWVWAASHGMWSSGVLLGLAVVVGLALDGRLDRRSAPRLLAVPLGSVVAAALTPVGPRLLLAASQSWGWQQYISEFRPAPLTAPAVAVTWLLIGVVAATWVRRPAPVSWARVGVLALAAFWTLFAFRSVTWGALMLTPLLAEAAQSWIGRRPDPRIGHGEGLALAALAIATLVVLAVLVPRTSTEPGKVPSGLDPALEAVPAGTPILNVYHQGGWLEWRHRQLAPVIDGNTNAYFLEDMEAYTAAIRVEPGWEDYVRETGVTHALLGEDDPLADALVQHLGWEVVDRADEHVLLRDPAAGGSG